MMTFGSLFAGIGGFDLGLERAGMVSTWQVEIDQFCQKILHKHWPNVEKFSDVRECGKHNLKPVDLICGGFPCQPHSLAGKRRGSKDDRDLWPEYRRIIDELKPRWVLAENVPGIRTTILDYVLSDLEDMDYTTGTLVVPACAFDAPHRRDRVFVIAYHDRYGCVRNRQQPWHSDTNRTQQETVGRRENSTNTQNEIPQSHGGGKPEYVTDAEISRLAHRRQAGKSAGEDEKEWQMAFARLERHRFTWWDVEPGVGRVANGFPDRVDRLKSLGNAVVPQVVEWLGRRIIEADKCAS